MKVLTVGGATVDTVVSIADNQVERMSLRNAESAYLLLEVGRKSEATDISVHCGGGATNAAVAFSRLGNETSTLVKLGKDFRADIITSQLTAEGISTRFVVHDQFAATGASVLLSAHESNTAVITFRGANTRVTPADLDPKAFAVDLVYIASLSDASADHFPQIVELAKGAGALVVANPGIRQLTTRQDAFRAALRNIDILSVNRHEATTLVPWLATQAVVDDSHRQASVEQAAPHLTMRGYDASNSTMTLADFLASLNALGPRMVVVTDGKNGAYIGTQFGITHCPALPVEIVGTAGAGDAFNATFAALVLMGASTDEASTAAAINSASVVTHLDTQSGLLRYETLALRMREQINGIKLSHWPSQHGNKTGSA